MARLTGIISKLNGSVGNLTFRQNGGQTIVSEKITQTTNAKTELQQKQRLKWANIIREYQVLQPYMKLAFGGTRNGRNDYNKFMSTNLSMTPVYLTKAEVNAGMCIVAPYEITHGTIRSIAVSGKGKKAVTDIRLGTLNITETTTVAEFSNAVVLNNKLYNYGDQITYFLVHQVVNEVTNIPMAEVDACCIVLDKSSEAKLLSLVDVRGFSVQEKHLAAQADNDFGNHGMVWIHSRKQSAKTLVSTQNLICENSLLTVYQSKEAYTDAILSYGGAKEAFLTPSYKVSSGNLKPSASVPSNPTPSNPDPVKPNPVDPNPVNPDPVKPTPGGKKVLSLTAIPAEGGTMVGAGTYDAGSEVKAEAIANEDFKFRDWEDGDSFPNRDVILNEDLSLTARFDPITEGADKGNESDNGGNQENGGEPGNTGGQENAGDSANSGE